MLSKNFFFFSLLLGGIFAATFASAQTCPHIYQGINCGTNWYCNGCQTSCKICPGAGDPAGATVLNYVSCTCNCPPGKIVCAGACVTPPACPTVTREQDNSSCNGCGACKSGYSSDPLAPDSPNPCLKTAYIDYANVGYFQVSGDLKSTGGDLYLANGKSIRIDGAGTTTLDIGNWNGSGTGADVSIWGNLNIGDAGFQRGLAVSGGVTVGAVDNKGAGKLNAVELCIAGSCRSTWPEAVSAFVDEGNVGFGPTAVLGTNDNVPLAFETNNIERMRIDTSGNVGIGTTIPAAPLEIEYNNTIWTNPAILIDNPAVVGGQDVIDFAFAGGTQARFRKARGGDFFMGTEDGNGVNLNTGGSARMKVFGNGDVIIGDDLTSSDGQLMIRQDLAADIFNLYDGSTNVFTVLDGGNVGIGTATPDAKLTVSGSTIRFINSGGVSVILTDTSRGVDQKNWQISNAGSKLVFGTLNDAMSAVSPVLTMLRSGNKIGIGTATPGSNNAELEVKANGGMARIYINGFDVSASNPELDLGNGTNYWAVYRDEPSDQLRFWKDDNRMVITSAGNVGIGTTDPGTYKLYIAGDENITNNLVVDTNTLFVDAANNRVGIGKSNPNYTLEISSTEERAIFATTSNSSGITPSAVQGWASASGAVTNYGGLFQADGQGGVGVRGIANNLTGINYGGSFASKSTSGRAIYALADAAGAATNYGGFFESKGDSGYGVWGQATATSGTNYGIYGMTASTSGWAGYFTGSGRGLYADKLVAGSATDPGTYKLYVTGDGYLSSNLTVKGNLDLGTKTVYRCVTAGALPAGALTITSGSCGTFADTGLRVK